MESRFGLQHDILLLKEILQIDPENDEGWNTVARNLNKTIQRSDVTFQSCRERLESLVEQSIGGRSLQKGSNEELRQRELLLEIIQSKRGLVTRENTHGPSAAKRRKLEKETVPEVKIKIVDGAGVQPPSGQQKRHPLISGQAKQTTHRSAGGHSAPDHQKQQYNIPASGQAKQTTPKNIAVRLVANQEVPYPAIYPPQGSVSILPPVNTDNQNMVMCRTRPEIQPPEGVKPPGQQKRHPVISGQGKQTTHTRAGESEDPAPVQGRQCQDDPVSGHPNKTTPRKPVGHSVPDQQKQQNDRALDLTNQTPKQIDEQPSPDQQKQQNEPVSHPTNDHKGLGVQPSPGPLRQQQNDSSTGPTKRTTAKRPGVKPAPDHQRPPKNEPVSVQAKPKIPPKFGGKPVPGIQRQENDTLSGETKEPNPTRIGKPSQSQPTQHPGPSSVPSKRSDIGKETKDSCLLNVLEEMRKSETLMKKKELELRRQELQLEREKLELESLRLEESRRNGDIMLKMMELLNKVVDSK